MMMRMTEAPAPKETLVDDDSFSTRSEGGTSDPLVDVTVGFLVTEVEDSTICVGGFNGAVEMRLTSGVLS